jgi:hypothetical protein
MPHARPVASPTGHLPQAPHPRPVPPVPATSAAAVVVLVPHAAMVRAATSCRHATYAATRGFDTLPIDIAPAPPLQHVTGSYGRFHGPMHKLFLKNGDHEWARFCKRDVVNRKSAQHSASSYCVDEFPLPMHGPHLGPVSGSGTQAPSTCFPVRTVRRLGRTRAHAAAISCL